MRSGAKLTLGDIDALERQLRASIVALNKSGVGDVTIIEAVDEASLWPDTFEDLGPIVSGHDLDTLVNRAPLFICAIAAEIGFRFEGVGTEYWAKLSDSMGLSITMPQRSKIGEAFEALQARYKISRPSESAFTSHFSIISWPIANALLPIDLVGPVTRLLARAPLSALPGPGRVANFASLRAWASAAEGARLGDWLRFEHPSSRVLTALLTENRGSTLGDASYTRLRESLAIDPEAFFAARAARLRSRTAKPLTAAEKSIGQLTLAREATGLRLFAHWPPLPPLLFDDARIAARSAGWRPRLWGAGAYLHPDNALGPGPFVLTLDAAPHEDEPAYPGAAEVFGTGHEIAAALAARSIEWPVTLVFNPDDDGKRAEQRFTPIDGTSGKIWIARRSDTIAFTALRKLGIICGYTLYEADLSNNDDREILSGENLLSAVTRTALARHPTDAISAGPGVVRPDRPFLLYRGGPEVADERPMALAPGGRINAGSHAAGSPGVRAENSLPADENTINIILFERDSAFEALVENRLHIRVESKLPLVNIPISVDLEIGGLLVARGRDRIATLPSTISRLSAAIRPLYADVVRAKLLQEGKGRLRIAVGHSTAIEIALERAPASVDWSNETPELVGAEMTVSLVGATAHSPHRFEPLGEVAMPARGAAAFGLRLADGRIADPVRLLTSDVFDLGDLTSHFGDDVGSRRVFENGRGVGDLARGRVAWARALCHSLSAIAAKSRVVRQFEEPLVVDLCGRAWALSEARIKDRPTDAHVALWLTALDRGLAVLPDQAIDKHSDVFGNAFAKHARAFDSDWPVGSLMPIDGAMDHALNAAFSEALVTLHARGELLDVEDDFDFGSPAEDWEAAAVSALKTIQRPPLVKLLAPTNGARQLAQRSYSDLGIAEVAEDLAAWTKTWALPRGQLSAEVAASALQLWLSPAACDGVDAAVHVLANDPFVARASRYISIRFGADNAAFAA